MSGMRPAFIDVGTVDLFRGEDIAFESGLMQGHVSCQLPVDTRVDAPKRALA